MIINDYAEAKGLAPLKLNLGCGGRPLPGWVNIDKYDYDPADTSGKAFGCEAADCRRVIGINMR